MKNVLPKTLASVALLACTGAAQAAYQDIAVNGGFESGDFTGWATFPGPDGAASQTIVSEGASEGSFAARLTEVNAAPNIIKQANLLPGAWTPGQQIDISFDIRGTAAAGGVFFAEVFTEIEGEGVSGAEILGGGPLFPNSDPDVWTSYSFSTTVGADPSGGMTLQFASICAPVNGCIADYFIDNVTIFADVETSPIPVPAAAWLFGSALLGLTGIARKKKAA